MVTQAYPAAIEPDVQFFLRGRGLTGRILNQVVASSTGSFRLQSFTADGYKISKTTGLVIETDCDYPCSDCLE